MLLGLIFRFAYLAYVFVFWSLLATLLLRFLLGRIPYIYSQRKLRYLLVGATLALLWPMALFTPNGRKTLRSQFSI